MDVYEIRNAGVEKSVLIEKVIFNFLKLLLFNKLSFTSFYAILNVIVLNLL